MDIVENIENLKKRANQDTLKVGERTFKIGRYDPLLGNYILLKLFTMVLPFGIGDMLKSQMGGGTEMIPASTSNAQVMSKNEFLELQRDILSSVSEVLKGDNPPVVRENGTYGIADFTANLSLQLLIASIAFNFSDFFGESQSEN